MVEGLSNNRVISILDMDAFELQVYLRIEHPHDWIHLYKTRPIVLAQNFGNILVSINHNAKLRGINRKWDLDKAEKRVRNLVVLRKASAHGKPETRRITCASREVLCAIQRVKAKCNFKFILELASPDEFYFDLTEDVHEFLEKHDQYDIGTHDLGRNTFLESRMGSFKGIHDILDELNNIRDESRSQYENERMLLVGAKIMQTVRQFVYDECGSLSSSCGVGSNKLMCKLAVAAHKPSGITILSDYGLSRFSESVAIDSIPGFHGETGQNVLQRAKDYFNQDEVFMSHLHNLPLSELLECLDCDPIFGRYVSRLVNGECDKPVVPKLMFNSVSSSKSFKVGGGKSVKIHDLPKVDHTIKNLCADICEKLEDDNLWNNRTCKVLNVKVKHEGFGGSLAFVVIDIDFEFRDAKLVINLMKRMYRRAVGKVNGNPVISNFEIRAGF